MAQTKSMQLSAYGISDMIENLGFLQDNINTACEDIVKELVTKGLDLAFDYDNMAPLTGNTDYHFEIGDTGSTKDYIAMTGADSVYVEFGTGDVGANNPHPLHNKVDGINPYNSGPTIRMDHMGNHYWLAPKGAMNLFKVGGGYYEYGGLTSGIPAGCQMYYTLIDLKDIAPDIAKKYLSQAIKKFTV